MDGFGTLTLIASVGGISACVSAPPFLRRTRFRVRRRRFEDCLRVLLGISLLSVKRRMRISWILLGLVALAIVVFFRSTRESMTNKHLTDTLKTFGEKGTKTKDVHQEAIYGPKTTKVEEPKPTAGKSKHGEDDTNVYPDIYGPEITPIPGGKVCKKGSHESDCTDNEAYQFNPDFDKAFPRESNEPQPFLTDFSQFQH